MALVDLVMPKLGESIMEATILKWHKQPGDKIKQDETLLEIATDKVDSELPSTAEGIVEEILFKENDVVPIGAVIARIRNSVEETAQNGSHIAPASGQTSPSTYTPVERNTTNVQESAFAHAAKSYEYTGSLQGSNGHGNGSRFYSPLVLNIAANEHFSMTELERIKGSGNEGRVTKKDILQYVSDKKSGSVPAPEARFERKPELRAEENQVSEPAASQPEYSYSGNVEIQEMDRMRKLIAEHMVRSKHTSPHVTSFTEADVTNLVVWRDKVKQEFEKREGTKITFTPLFIEAVVRCIKKYPLINCSVDRDKIIIKKDINIGMATALPSGNLIVPVIRNADQFNLVGLTRQVNNLADQARNNKLRPEDIQGGTFTLTNVGIFGSLMGTPIINQPQVAILAIGAIKKRPVVIETEQGDAIAIRHMMYLSMSYDHRVVDGSVGAGFLSDLAKELENFDPSRAF